MILFTRFTKYGSISKKDMKKREERHMGIQFVVNDKGKPTGVIMDIKDYEEMLERLEDSEALEMLSRMREETLEYVHFDNFKRDNRINIMAVGHRKDIYRT
jgi:PHD/YefM family antitoxin component YafN of YafNO toxin-antitoxin module